jgi:diamine N-acetyltransferase
VTAHPSFQLAEESDAAVLLNFMRAYYAFDGHAFDEQKARSALIPLLRDSKLGRVWLILDGQQPVGYIAICFGYSLEWLGRDAFVDELFLLEEYRGCGWGRKTIALVEGVAYSLGIKALHLEVVRKNAAALDIYQRLGFKDRESTFMSKWIGRDPS